MDKYTTLEEIFFDRIGRSSVFFEIYMAGYRVGAGIPDATPHSDSMRQLIWLLEDRRRAESDPPILADELPGWLLSLSSQADAIEPPPSEGWPI